MNAGGFGHPCQVPRSHVGSSNGARVSQDDVADAVANVLSTTPPRSPRMIADASERYAARRGVPEHGYIRYDDVDRCISITLTVLAASLGMSIECQLAVSRGLCAAVQSLQWYALCAVSPQQFATQQQFVQQRDLGQQQHTSSEQRNAGAHAVSRFIDADSSNAPLRGCGVLHLAQKHG